MSYADMKAALDAKAAARRLWLNIDFPIPVKLNRLSGRLANAVFYHRNAVRKVDQQTTEATLDAICDVISEVLGLGMTPTHVRMLAVDAIVALGTDAASQPAREEAVGIILRSLLPERERPLEAP